MNYETRYKTLYESFFRHKNIFLDISMMLMGVVLLAVLSQVYIPLWPVPITGQTFGIFLLAFWFGSRKGLATIGIYIIAGLLGFGVFSKQASGIAVLLGPTGGYIVGFLAAVFYVGYKIEKGHGRTKKSIISCMVVGSIMIYASGLIGLWLNFPSMTFAKLLMVGMVPFLIGDAVKIAAAVALFPFMWKGAEKLNS